MGPLQLLAQHLPYVFPGTSADLYPDGESLILANFTFDQLQNVDLPVNGLNSNYDFINFSDMKVSINNGTTYHPVAGLTELALAQFNVANADAVKTSQSTFAPFARDSHYGKNLDEVVHVLSAISPYNFQTTGNALRFQVTLSTQSTEVKLRKQTVQGTVRSKMPPFIE
jgi:hypothetical protein